MGRECKLDSASWSRGIARLIRREEEQLDHIDHGIMSVRDELDTVDNFIMEAGSWRCAVAEFFEDCSAFNRFRPEIQHVIQLRAVTTRYTIRRNNSSRPHPGIVCPCMPVYARVCPCDRDGRRRDNGPAGSIRMYRVLV